MNINKIKINNEEIKFLSLSYCDQQGRLFTFSGKLYRGISESMSSDVYLLFKSGLIDILIERGLFPITKISKYETDEYPLVIEHDYINNVSYSHEWTFEMLKVAALATLEVNNIVNDYGYEIKDAHADNIVFDGVAPRFIDLGSITKKRTDDYWIATERFIQSFIYPLLVWKKCGEFVARRLLMGNEYMPHTAFLLLNHPLLRCIDHALLAKLLFIWSQYRKAPCMGKEELNRKLSFLPPFLAILFKALHKYKLLPFTEPKSAKLVKIVKGIKRNRPYSVWTNYHTIVAKEKGDMSSYERFNIVTNILKNLQCRTVTELGANQTELARLILSKTDVIAITCLDIDEGALDIGFLNNYSSHMNITHAVIDVMAPMTTHPKEFPHYRFISEAVIALALTHHLTLGQGFDINRVIDRIRDFTKRYALIEFMPFGLDTTFRGLGLPSWYNEEWFRVAFEKRFRILSQTQIETNRILYVGEVF